MEHHETDAVKIHQGDALMFAEQLAASLKDTLAQYKPLPKPQADPAKAKRRKQIADSMARIRARRRAAGLNAHGKPHGGIGGRPRIK